jgi:hypothetical protein
MPARPRRAELPEPPAEMTERVVAAALAALPRRRRRLRRFGAAGALLAATAAAIALAVVPSGAGIPPGPLPFFRLTSGTAPADPLGRRNIPVFAFVHANFLFADGFVETFGLGEKTHAALDRMDFNTHLALFILARREMLPVRLTMRKLGPNAVQLCAYVRLVSASAAPDYAYTVTAVKKPAGFDRAVDRNGIIVPIVREGKRLISPRPAGKTRPGLCP